MLTTATSTSLLEALKDSGNSEAWSRYVERYRPLIVAFGSRLGLAREDAEDAAQAALFEFCEALRAGRYERDRGRLRSWMFGIAHRQVLNLRRRVARARERTSVEPHSGFFAQTEDPAGSEAAWDEEWRRAVLRQGLEEVRHEVEPRTFQAFSRFALDEVPAETVAAELGISQNAVFGAKRRVLRRLRDVLPLMEDVF